MHKKTLRDNGIKVISATEFIPDSPEGIILESMLEGYAEYYSAELSQKVRRGMKETRLKGNFTGGHLLYGYSLENQIHIRAIFIRRICKGHNKVFNRKRYLQQRKAVRKKHSLQYLKERKVFGYL